MLPHSIDAILSNVRASASEDTTVLETVRSDSRVSPDVEVGIFSFVLIKIKIFKLGFAKW